MFDAFAFHSFRIYEIDEDDGVVHHDAEQADYAEHGHEGQLLAEYVEPQNGSDGGEGNGREDDEGLDEGFELDQQDQIHRQDGENCRDGDVPEVLPDFFGLAVKLVLDAFEVQGFEFLKELVLYACRRIALGDIAQDMYRQLALVFFDDGKLGLEAHLRNLFQ